MEKERYRKARRIIYNSSANDWNDEPEYKLQKVRVYRESNSGKSYLIDSYGNKKFSCDKTQIFLSKKDFEEKIDNIQGFNLTDFEKQYLLKQFE